jgi:hypothetical protein
MSQSDRPRPPDHATTPRAVGLRLLTSLVAFTAGVIALVIALLLLRSALG